MIIVPVGNVLQKLYEQPLSIQKKFKPLVKKIMTAEDWREKQLLAWELANKLEDNISPRY